MRAMMCAAALLAMASVGPAVSAGRVAYVPLPHVGGVTIGGGGHHFYKHGIDWWTSGAPARRFEALGTLTDYRERLPLSADALGSAEIAEVVRRRGADAVIVRDVVESFACLPVELYLCRGGRIRGHAEGVTRRATRMTAIRYL